MEMFDADRPFIIEQIEGEIAKSNFAKATQIARSHHYARDKEIDGLYIKAKTGELLSRLGELQQEMITGGGAEELYPRLEKNYGEQAEIYRVLSKLHPDNQSYKEGHDTFSEKHKEIRDLLDEMGGR